MKTIHPALMFAFALLAAAATGCNEKSAAPKKSGSASAVPVEPVVPQAAIVIEGVPVEDQPALKNLLRVDGVMRRGSEYVVALNGQVVKAGEYLRLTVRGRDYVLEVLNIASDRILLKATTKGEERSTPSVPSPVPKAAQ